MSLFGLLFFLGIIIPIGIGILIWILIIRYICNYLAKRTAEETAKRQEQGKTTFNQNQQPTPAPTNPTTKKQEISQKSVPWKWE